MEKEERKLKIAITVLIIVCILSLGVITLTIHSANKIVKNAKDDYKCEKNYTNYNI